MPTSLTLPLHLLHPHPQNARIGNTAHIKASLKAHGQFKPLLITQDTEGTSYTVIAGNHTLAALKELATERGESNPTAQCWLIDVDEQQAKKIMLADNRASDNSAYDHTALTELLDTLDTLDGTGWDITPLDDPLPTPDPIEPDTYPYADFITITLRIPQPLNDQWQHWCHQFDSPEEALEYLLDHGPQQQQGAQ